MKGRLHIDGIDAFTKYGVFVEHYGYKSLVQFPSLKDVAINSWAEEDGIEADLSNPQLDTRDLEINFYVSDYDLVGGLIEKLSDGAYHIFNFSELGKVLSLRLVSELNNNRFKRAGKFTLQFADDEPFWGYEYLVPKNSFGVVKQGYEIDGVDISEYSVYILDGTDDSVLKSPSVKKNLLINVNHRSGAIYDGESVFFETKDVTLKCLIRANNKEEFWRNYNALFWNLTRPSERELYWERTGEPYPCYYKSSNVSKFDILQNGRIWCEFSIVLVFTSFRCRGVEMLLASEVGEWIITEDGINAIDLNYGDS